MKHKLPLLLFCIVAMTAQAYAQTPAKHSVGASWSCLGFNSTHSKNSDKKTFGTIGVNYEYRFNEWVAVTGNMGWTHSWFAPDADPVNAYPKKDNAIILLAGCDVSWFRKGIVRLHSGVAGGVDIRVQKNDRGSYSTAGLAGQLDAIGLKLDFKGAYVDMSAGWGSLGCMRIGGGIRF